MRLAFPHYEGDGFLRALVAPAAVAPIKVFKPVAEVQRSIPEVSADEVIYSTLDLEFQARALRRDYLRQWVKGIFGQKDE